MGLLTQPLCRPLVFRPILLSILLGTLAPAFGGVPGGGPPKARRDNLR
jgi:hypothetical protein